jgi:TatD DNase family protein
MQWIDIGVNLTHESFTPDRAEVIARARAAGVAQMIVTGADVEGSAAALHLARSYPHVLFATAGVHPHHAANLAAEELPRLRELLVQPEVVAVGECGLDYYRNFSPRDAQRRAFEWQLGLALESGKPLFLHQRDAHADFLAILRAQTSAPLRGVAHCFTGNADELEAYLALGLSVGITGWFCDERRGRHLGPLMSRIPAGRLLLETDAPYLLPRDLRSRPPTRRNEPMYLPHVGAAVAAARAESVTDCAAHSSAHARALFGLPEVRSVMAT